MDAATVGRWAATAAVWEAEARGALRSLAGDDAERAVTADLVRAIVAVNRSLDKLIVVRAHAAYQALVTRE
jgi:hypothetical protein